jgi:uncharacterized protein YndB with AHSA1/START domain
MPVPPEAVWDVLADPGSFGYWVVGSRTIRDADADWPRPGSKFHHTVGLGPFEVSDHTVAVDTQRPGLFAMRAKARPAGTASVTLTMTPAGGGTLVRLTESPDGVFSLLSLNPLVHVTTRARNAESLMRLEELALRKGQRGGAPRGRARVP